LKWLRGEHSTRSIQSHAEFVGDKTLGEPSPGGRRAMQDVNAGDDAGKMA
jgi:hypothetical protein